LSNGIAAIGWAEIGDLSDVHSREEIATRLAEHYPEYTKPQLSANTGQVWRFRDELVAGETVLTYDPNERVYHFGEVTGDYSFRPDLDPELRHSRSANWSDVVPRDKLSGATKNSLGSISTIFCISPSAADEILSLIVSPAVDPEPQGQPPVSEA